MKEFRAPAVPLLNVDPMFSLWSFADRLTDDTTRHWSGVRQFISGVIMIDGIVYEFMGKVNPVNRRYHTGYPAMEQTRCEIRPMTTVYEFETAGIRLTLTFTSPLLLGEPEIMSRPLTYLTYKIDFIDGKKHEYKIYLGVSGEFCVNEPEQEVWWGETEQSVYFTSGTDNMLVRAGDDHRIEWGSLHIAAPQMEHEAMPLMRYQMNVRRESVGDRLRFQNYLFYPSPNMEQAGPKEIEPGEKCVVGKYWPVLVFTQELDAEYEGRVVFAYDDIKSIQYFGKNLDAYWKKDGMTFDEMLGRGIAEYEEIIAKVAAAEEKLMADSAPFGEKYQQILALAYREAVAGHKLVIDDGTPLFFSKENYSNGSIGTVDVTYPSIPLFLLECPSIVRGMLEPIFELVYRGKWEYEFAPHDVGTYPLANGQTYGFIQRHVAKRPNPRDSQMPVEECGNMILCVAAVCHAEGDKAYFEKHRKLLTQWADYLVDVGYDPERQLCTDDFAGHLAHNCNLSVKGICALGAFAELSGEAKYREAAERFAAQWLENAAEGDHYKLTFDSENTWSIKYNMVWDRLLGLGLFPDEVYKKEAAWYKKVMNPYGLPMDSRGEYTKSDWQMWAAAMCEDAELADMIIDAMYAFLVETPDRVPFTDLYFTSAPRHRGFQARTVQAGLWMPILYRKWTGK